MSSERIVKQRPASANMPDYEAACAAFTWTRARAALDGLPGGGLNITHEAVTRHAQGSLRDTVALRWQGKRGQRVERTYAELERRSARFANLLGRLGVGVGDAVFSLTGRVPELYDAVLGSLRAGVLFCPLFSAYGLEPILARMGPGRAKLLLTTTRLYERKLATHLAELREQVPSLEHVLLIDGDPRALPPGTLSLRAELELTPANHTIPPTDPEHPALLHFTSGTTGKPKGALHVHEAVVAHMHTARVALDLRDGDRFWCTADPGWVTGMSYGVIAPLCCGVTSIIDEAEFDARRWYQTLQDERVTVWYTAPTAIRMLMRAGPELAREYDLSSLRFIASVGEPLNPEAVRWGMEVFGRPIHDNWWQTETGGIMIANYASMDIKPGAMGKPLPGVAVGIVERGEDGKLRELAVGREGELALRTPWPSMFRAYLHDELRYRACFSNGWYLTGDLARRDAEGYLWFVGRTDDVIKSAGHLIGPFEVESALLEHPAVAEAAVIGKPDELAGRIVKAFVSLVPRHTPSPELQRELLGFARTRLGAAVAPRELEFRAELPKTRSGKLMRRLLLAHELGLPEGDTSSLEGRQDD